MKYKLLQLNIYKGKYLKQIVDFVKDNHFDILNLQEVAGGQAKSSDQDCFHFLRSSLKLKGELAVSWRGKADQLTYMANSIFYSSKLNLVNKSISWLKPYREIDWLKTRFQDMPRNLLCLDLSLPDHKSIRVVNTHLVWGPNPRDKKFKLIQGEKLFQFMKRVKPPFILSGDFNVTPNSQIVSWMENLANNQTVQNGVTNTLNPKTHREKKLFPKGLAVDYIFTSKDLKITDFQLIDRPDLSDHFGLSVEFEV